MMKEATDLASARQFVEEAAAIEHSLYLRLCELQGQLPRGCRGRTRLDSFAECSRVLLEHKEKINIYKEAIAGFGTDALARFNKIVAESGIEIPPEKALPPKPRYAVWKFWIFQLRFRVDK
jgi:hypothetical protein